MSFKQGTFYAIQAKTPDGDTVFVQAGRTNHAEKLKLIARRAARMKHSYEDYDDYDQVESIKLSENPFALTVWPTSAKVKDVVDHMRSIRRECGGHVDPNSLTIVVVESSVSAYVPESPSDEETEMRRFVLEKLSPSEQKLLKVEHWSVYNKLADRSMLDDEED